jgi:hypothetical protein
MARFNPAWTLTGEKTGNGVVPEWLSAASRDDAPPEWTSPAETPTRIRPNWFRFCAQPAARTVGSDLTL